jgi:hypothetical protein
LIVARPAASAFGSFNEVATCFNSASRPGETMTTDDGAEKDVAQKKSMSRGNAWGVLFAGLILLGFGVYIALPVLLGTHEHGTVGDCTKHVNGGSTHTTSYECRVRLTNGSTSTVNFDSSQSFGERASVTVWRGQTVEGSGAILPASLLCGGGLVVLVGGVWCLLRIRTRSPGDAEVPSG